MKQKSLYWPPAILRAPLCGCFLPAYPSAPLQEWLEPETPCGVLTVLLQQLPCATVLWVVEVRAETYCGRFMPRFYGATRRPTRARIRPRSPCRPAGKSSYKGRPWGLGWRLTTDAPPPSSTAGMACRSKPASIVADSRCSVYLRPCLFTMSRTVSLTVQG